MAYETGLHIGDGNLSQYSSHYYRYVLSGNLRTELDYYQSVVVPLIERLYDLTPSISSYRNSVFATVYSKPLLLFKANIIGLPVGRKEQLQHLPGQILGRGQPNIAQLISGLYDADGSPKVRKTTSRCYPRISFAQKTRGIVDDVRRLLYDEFRITSTMYKNEYFDARSSVTEVRWFLDINGSDNLRKYIRHIGSRHPVFRAKLQLLSSLR